MTSNAEIGKALHEMADLLEIKGGDRYRHLAYRRAADAIAGVADPLCEMTEDRLVAIAGIGKGMAARITEMCRTGTMAALDELRAQVPIGLREMTLLPGVGPKRAMQLYRETGASTLDELKAAAEAGRISAVKGFGKRFEDEVLSAIARGVRADQRLLLARALPLAQQMLAALDEHPAVVRSAYCGSLRRMRETVGDIDLLVATRDPVAVMDRFRALPGVASSKSEGETRSSVVLTSGLQVDLRAVAPEVFGAALQYFTGSAAHNVRIRERAVRMGYKLSEYGLHRSDDGSLVVSQTEEEIYDRLGLAWIPPTMREDRGEIEAALDGTLPAVIELDDIRGDLQSHTTYSDGRLTVREMAMAAAERGYAYYAPTDHGPRLTYMKNLGLREIDEQRAEVRSVDAELGDRMRVLHGVELNIGSDGSLDYDDRVLAGFDICVASIHSAFRLSKREQTQRLLRAIENPHVHVIGHPSGRRLDRREGIDFDVAAVARAAARHHVALEVNAHPWRLDLRDTHVRIAMEQEAMLVISTDAHSVAEFDHMHYGVATAQRGWATADRVVNTWEWSRLRRFLAKED